MKQTGLYRDWPQKGLGIEASGTPQGGGQGGLEGGRTGDLSGGSSPPTCPHQGQQGPGLLSVEVEPGPAEGTTRHSGRDVTGKGGDSGQRGGLGTERSHSLPFSPFPGWFSHCGDSASRICMGDGRDPD